MARALVQFAGPVALYVWPGRSAERAEQHRASYRHGDPARLRVSGLGVDHPGCAAGNGCQDQVPHAGYRQFFSGWSRLHHHGWWDRCALPSPQRQCGV